ncbi:hypothetical protein ABW19_dt0207813 [Dactylella cylindrospora]|nr:hypothetical protein ABW19_dt0207813 [Dactylella cylindrospora]
MPLKKTRKGSFTSHSRQRRKVAFFSFTPLKRYSRGQQANQANDGSKTAALEERIDRLGDTRATDRQTAIDGVLTKIGELTHDLKDAANYLPSYDQKVYSEVCVPLLKLAEEWLVKMLEYEKSQLKSLSDQLSSARKALAPRAKFSFRNRKQTAPAEPAEAAASQASITHPSHIHTTESPPEASVPHGHEGISALTGSPISPAEAAKPQAPLGNSNRISSLSERESEYLIPSPATEITSILSLSSLTKCIVDNATGGRSNGTGRFANLAIKNIESSILLCGDIDGPVHMTSLNGSVLVVKCKQFRLHDSKDLDVYLSCRSRPIIERCKGVRFARLPKAFGGEDGDDDEARDMWRQVDDFNWLKEGKPSPNWRVMEENEGIDGETWDRLIDKERDSEVELDHEDQSLLKLCLPE